MPVILNEDILFKVFGFLAYSSSDGQKWSKQLPLLAVCSSWRRMALPLVYREAVINFQTPTEHTNIHLAASVGCIELIRHVNIQVGCGMSQAMDSALSILHTYQAVWPSTHTVCFSLEHQNTEQIDDGGWCKQMATKIASTFPLLRNMMLRSNKKCLNDARLFGQLAGIYSPQLSTLASNVPIIIEPTCKFNGLKTLALAIDNGDYAPSINPDIITSLKLVELPDNFAWNRLCGTGDAKEITFINLQKLSLVYQCEHTYENSSAVSFQMPKCNFPKLQNLKVNYSNPTAPLLFGDTDLAVSIDVHAPIETLDWLQNATQINKLALWATCNSKADMSSQLTKVCKLASQAKASKDVVVSITGNDVFSLPVKAEFRHLTRMHCYSPVYLGTVVNVARLVPSLAVLKCLYVIAEPCDELCSGDYQINELLLMFSVQRPDTDDWTVAVQSLLLRLTRLKSLALHGFPTALLYSLVDTHGTEHPHLSRINWSRV